MANGILTNCGVITPQNFDVFKFDGEPDITWGHIPYFHQMACKWAYNASLPFSWVIVITAQNQEFLLNKIKSISKRYEPQGWNIDSIVNDTWTRETQEVIGCIFAEGVRVPGESINTEHVGITDGSRNGYINAPIINGRADFEDLEIGFIETNQSFVDGVLRPWNIIAGHEGLIARPQDQTIKATISVYNLSRTGPYNKTMVRKYFNFFDAVPINVSGEDLLYSGATSYMKRQVKFTYNYYNAGTGADL